MSISRNWLLVLGVGMALCLAAVAFFVQQALPGGPFLPAYSSQQIPSTHPGYRRTTLSSRGVDYINDYDEYSLQLTDREPSQAVGRYGAGKVCAIPGQKPADYIAADVGSEMPAYEVFRNSKIAPFDWRHATFQSLDFSMPTGPKAGHIHTTDPALIADIIQTLGEGTAAKPQPVPGSMGNVFQLELHSDQLPGLFFSPSIYITGSGAIYVAESIVQDTTSAKTIQFTGRWIPASPQLTNWLQTSSAPSPITGKP